METISSGLCSTRKIEKSEVINLSTVPQIPVYSPTVSEFSDFMRCISKIEELGAHHVGLCKIIPPPGWVARMVGYNDIGSHVVDKPVCQVTHGSQGIFWQDIKPTSNLTFEEFSNLAASDRYCTPRYRDFDHLEKKYWSSVATGRPLYGANVSGSLMEGPDVWNLSKLDSILSRVFESEHVSIPGVNTPYLYYGMWRSTFPWHVEDVELYSINYLHFGAPKHWYVIPPAYARKFEAFVFEYFRSDFLNCRCFLRHKCVLISPSVLARAGIPTRKITQHCGEFMITFPYAYHAGFNMGLNIAEAVNFALPRWIDFGKKALICNCWDDTVRICMDPFIKLYQPDAYDDWLHGRDVSPHPLMEYSASALESDCSGSGCGIKLNDGPRQYLAVDRNPLLLVCGKKTRDLFWIGDLNLIDLRFSVDRLSNSKVPWHIVHHPELSSLWCGISPEIEVERFFNKLIGSYSPHCAVCSFLWSPQHFARILSSSIPSSIQRTASAPSISEVAYLSSVDGDSLPQLQFGAQDSAILRCVRCELCVHSRCYGLSSCSSSTSCQLNWSEPSIGASWNANNKLSSSASAWCCDACHAPKRPSCVLCYVRGGAMKPLANPANNFTRRRYWAHIVCALANPGCHFVSVADRVAAVSEKAIQTACDAAVKFKNTFTEPTEVNNRISSLKRRRMNTRNLTSSRKLSNPVYHPPSRQLPGCTHRGYRPSLSSTPAPIYGCSSSSRDPRRCLKDVDLFAAHPQVGTPKEICQSIKASKLIESNEAQLDYSTFVCSVCTLPTRGFLPLARCWFSKCHIRYHVTCAQLAGVMICSDSYPYNFYLACDSHPAKYKHCDLTTVAVKPGDEIMIRKNSNPPVFVPGLVIRRLSPLYCRIAFSDGTFSNDTPPEYLTNVDWAKDGPPQIGANVKVLWKDDAEYAGTFQGTTAEKWEVRTHDGEVFKLSKEQFYLRRSVRCTESKGIKRTLRSTAVFEDDVPSAPEVSPTYQPLEPDQISECPNVDVPSV